MTLDDLLAEARHLARQSVRLAPGVGEAAAFWGGLLGKPGDLVVAVRCDAHPGLSARLRGVLAIRLSGQGDDGYAVEHHAGADLRDFGDARAVPLVGRVAVSLPPVDALFRYGSDRLRDWVADNEWDSRWGGFGDEFRDQDTARGYYRVFQDQCPLYSGDCHAVLGGWHVPWPDGDWEEYSDQTLGIWTLADAEPWLEAWLSPLDEWSVVERTT